MKLPEKMNNRIRREAVSYELNSELELLDKPIEDEYTKAYTTGLKGSCWEQYDCPISLFTPINMS